MSKECFVMTTDISDGNFYLSRARCNRHTVTLEAVATDTYMGRLNLNGKVTQVVVDYSGIIPLASGSGTGSFTIFSDVKTTAGDEVPYHTTLDGIALSGNGYVVLDVTPGSDTQDRGIYPAFYNTSGDGSGNPVLHAENANVAIGKTSWNGLITGTSRILFRLIGSSPVGAIEGNVKVTIYTE